jgi:hypothetical protein
MSADIIAKNLIDALLNDGPMSAELFEDGLMPNIKEFRASMEKDGDDFVFVIAEREGAVAMVLLEPGEKTFVNGDARERLKALWPRSYGNNMEVMIPEFADDIENGELAIVGVNASE